MRIWTTETQPDHLQFSYWREVLCEAFVALDPIRKEPEQGFPGRVSSSALGQTMRTQVFSRKQFVNRRPQEIRRNPIEVCFVNIQLSGACVVRQDDQECLVPPGSFSIVDSTRPYYLNFVDDWNVLSLRIPRRELLPKLAMPRSSMARCVNGTQGLGMVAMQFAQSLGHLQEDVDAATEDGLSAALSNVIAMSVGARADAKEAGRPAWRDAQRRAIEKYIDAHHDEAQLSPDVIASRFGLSRRSLYALFEETPVSISGLIRRTRLERCARALAQPGRRQSVLEIAMENGFTDLSHFSRCFKHRFGMSPRAFAYHHANERRAAPSDK